MARAGGRKYARDKNGKFASTGGGGGGKSGGGSNAAATRKTNSARAADLKAKGTTAIGGRVKAKGFAGGKGAQDRAGGLRNQKRIMDTGKGSGPRTSASMGTVGVSPRQARTVGAGTRSQLKANAAQVNKNRSRAASKGTQKMSKAPANAAKERYKELSSRARKSSPERSAAENRAAAGARRSLATMEAKRGVTKPAKRSRKK
jgi:hypothetical protein